ncbi:MAG: alpha-ketoacid dehydrogenase subunit beta [Acidobacteriota bacterium]|nr:alpha-ketoacid dehydrogenase subunit beta [Acidobacteriota bacterium]
MNERHITYAAALNEAMSQAMGRDANVCLLGLGVDDPAAVFGSTRGLKEKYGPDRTFDIPISEAAVMGVAIGAALRGMRPVVAHLRLEFALLATDQIVNQAAKWRFIFGERASVPVTVRMVIGRGWGQSAQHSQSLHAWYAHVPGLKVVAPATPRDAKGLLTSAIEDDDPVIVIEHRWLYDISGPVPEHYYSTPIGVPAVLRPGHDVTIVGSSYMTLEAYRASLELERLGVSAEVIDLRTIAPLDTGLILESVGRTGRLIVCDQGTRTGGFAGEIICRVAESALGSLKAPPRRITLPDAPAPAARALANFYYPQRTHIVAAALEAVGRESFDPWSDIRPDSPLDVVDASFTGPF